MKKIKQILFQISNKIYEVSLRYFIWYEKYKPIIFCIVLLFCFCFLTYKSFVYEFINFNEHFQLEYKKNLMMKSFNELAKCIHEESFIDKDALLREHELKSIEFTQSQKQFLGSDTFKLQ